MATFKVGSPGKIAPELLHYYEKQTRDGYFGMVITEHAIVSVEGISCTNQIPSAENDKVDSSYGNWGH